MSFAAISLFWVFLPQILCEIQMYIVWVERVIGSLCSREAASKAGRICNKCAVSAYSPSHHLHIYFSTTWQEVINSMPTCQLAGGRLSNRLSSYRKLVHLSLSLRLPISLSLFFLLREIEIGRVRWRNISLSQSITLLISYRHTPFLFTHQNKICIFYSTCNVNLQTTVCNVCKCTNELYKMKMV